jgi:Zn-dependent protease
MDANIKLGRILGIPVGLNVSWFIIFLLLTFSLSTQYFPDSYPGLSVIWTTALGLVTTILFLGSVLAHELGHAMIAIRNQIPVRGITLFMFGGVAQIGREPQTPGAEFRIAIAGPAVSFGLAGLFGLLYLLDQNIPYLSAPSRYLMQINFMLGLFNLIPGFPLDGGRVLRAAIWRLTNSYDKATRAASISGQVVAFGFIGFGIFQVFTGSFINGLWMGFIGWFLLNAASGAYSQLKVQRALSSLTVSQAMDRDAIEITHLTPLSQLVEWYVLARGKTNFYVMQDGMLAGILTMKEISSVPQEKWPFTPAQRVMTPLRTMVQIQPDMELLQAVEAMENARVGHAPVIDCGILVGILSLDHVANYLRLRSELGV